jgi:guanylate kinase
MKDGKAIIFSAPSGSGKTTIVRHLLRNFNELAFSISATTRPRRTEREIDGKDYYFLTTDEFKRKIDEHAFVEWEEVYNGNFYGTLRSEVERLWSEGKHVLFDVDVKGGIKLNEYFKEKGLAIFVKVKDMAELEKRLRHRNTETEDHIKRRLSKAKYEMSFEDKFDITLISEDLSTTLKKAEQLVMEFIKQPVS